MVVSLAGMQFVRPTPRATTSTVHWRHSIKTGGEQAVGSAQANPERRARSVAHNMALRARVAAIPRVRAGGRAPPSSRISIRQALKQSLMQPTSALHARAQNNEDAGQGGSVVDPRPATSGLSSLWRQERPNCYLESIGKKVWACQANSLTPVLLGTLSISGCSKRAG